MDEILSELSVKMKKEFPKRALTNENLLNYYRERLRKNLHIVLCFSPDNRKFRERALKFPALVSGCTIDWFALITLVSSKYTFNLSGFIVGHWTLLLQCLMFISIVLKFSLNRIQLKRMSSN